MDIRRWLARDARLALVRVLWETSAPLMCLLGATLALEALLAAGFALASGALVAAVPEAAGAGYPSPAADRLLAALVAVVLVFIGGQVLEPFEDALVATVGRRLAGRFGTRGLRAALLPSGIAHLEDPATVDLLARVRGAAQGQYPPAQASRGLVNLAQKALRALTSTALIWMYYRWWLAVGLLLALLVGRAWLRRDVLRAVGAMTGATPVMRRADYFLELALQPGAGKEIRVFGLGDWVADRFRRHWLGAMAPVWVERRTGTRTVAPLATLLVLLPLLLTFGLVGWSAARGEIGVGALAIVAQSALTMTAWLFSINLPEQWLEYGAPSAQALLALESAGTVTPQTPGATGGKSAEGLPRRSIRFEGVSFRYPGSATEVFSGLDLEVPAGRSLALVGANGAGKTTLVKLLTGMYAPTGGRITVDGTDLRELDIESWRRRFAVVFQDFVRWELSAAENVGFGAIDSADGRALLQTAAERAGAHGTLARLPRGWDTPLSPRYERGVDLSGGEWQRVALARALFAVGAGAGVLVLDEPAAALDARAEAELYDRFLEITEGLTTILISHRFSSVRRADAICVLEGGRVTERGSHEELLARGGRYSAMFRLQAGRFRPDGPDDA